MRRLFVAALVTTLIGGGVAVSAAWSVRTPRTLPRVTEVVVEKSARRLTLRQGDIPVAHYRVSLGATPEGHKHRSGDERTPEGHYVLDWRNARSRYYKSLHVSYPNAADTRAARAAGVNPGGDIMVHGMPNGFGWAAPVLRWLDWTNGCVAVDNVAMEEIWRAVPVGTPITILP